VSEGGTYYVCYTTNKNNHGDPRHESMDTGDVATYYRPPGDGDFADADERPTGTSWSYDAGRHIRHLTLRRGHASVSSFYKFTNTITRGVFVVDFVTNFAKLGVSRIRYLAFEKR
jgi:hypothetical protein